jgi:hypothetical protein
MCVLHRARTAGFLVLIGLLAASAGCGVNYKAKGIVKGQVVFFDKKLTAGTVSFQTADGRSGAGNIDFNGNYTVTDAPVGPCTVTVTVPKVSGMPPGMKAAAKPPGTNMPPMKQPGSAETEDASLIDPSKIVQIPTKYSKTDTSGLTFTVERGEQTHNITLTP